MSSHSERPSSVVAVVSRVIEPYRGLGSSLWSMFFATMINRFGDFVGAFLALYLTRILHYDSVRTGAVVSLVFASSMAGSFVSGRLGDLVGRKRALIIAQSAAAGVNLALSLLWSRPWAPFLIAVGAFFGGGARPLIGAVLTDLAPPARRKEVFGLQYWSINVGVALGPLVAAFLFDHAIALLFGGSALCTAFSVLLIARGVDMPAHAGAASSLERSDERGAFKAFLARPILLAFMAISVANSLTYSQTFFALPLSLSTSFGVDGPRYLGFMISLNAALVIALSIPVTRALRGLPPLVCMSLSGLFYVVGFGMLSFKLSLAGYAFSTAIWTLGEIVGSNVFGIFVARHSPANWRASFQSFMSLSFGAGNTVGPLVAGPLIAAGGAPVLWTGVAVLCAVWSVSTLFVARWDSSIAPTR